MKKIFLKTHEDEIYSSNLLLAFNFGIISYEINKKGLTYPEVSLIGSEICQHKRHVNHKKYFDQILANLISLLIDNSTMCSLYRSQKYIDDVAILFTFLRYFSFYNHSHIYVFCVTRYCLLCTIHNLPFDP